MNSKSLSFIFLLVLFSQMLWASERQQPVSKAIKSDFVHYKKQSYSLVPWSDLNERAWMDFREWKRDLTIRETLADWQKAARDAGLVETVGRLLDCVGTCYIYHGETPTKARFRSEILEGDEVVTKEDSYAWLYLMDGTLVRMSPQSSVSFKEINVGSKEVFFHARMNYGNILWMSRNANTFAENDLSETDQLFLPLVYSKANYYENHDQKEDDVLSLVDAEGPTIKQYRKLNQMIGENIKKAKSGVLKEHTAFLIMPNGTIFGKNLTMEFVVLVGGDSYFKKRSFKEYNPEASEDESPTAFYYRGFDSKQPFDVEKDRWYHVSLDGREIFPYDEKSGELNFYIGEYLTARIPTIFFARELLWQEYSDFTYKNLSAQDLGSSYNYRLWGSFSEEKSDLTLRLEFLKEHTRRVETTQLRLAEQYKKKREERGEKIFQMDYDEKYYGKAMRAYLFKQGYKNTTVNNEILNSTKKRFWELINGRR